MTIRAGGGTFKRSVTLRHDVDAGIQKLAGQRGYSAFINDAAILALQAQAVDAWLTDYEQRNPPPALLKAVAGKNILFVASHTVAEFYREGGTVAKQGLLGHQWRVEYAAVTLVDGQLAGKLLGQSGGNNSMDALLIAMASHGRFSHVFTSDPDDLERLRADLKPPEWRDFAIVDIR